MARKEALLSIGVSALLAMAVAACGGGTQPAPTQAPSKPATGQVPAAATSAPAGAAAATKPAATQSTTATAGNVAAGKAVFDQNCNSCHPGGGQGAGPSLKGKNPSADRIKRQVRNGGGGMPAFPESRISEQQLNDLVAYIQSLQ